jgi:hypothetical protein
MNKVLVGVLGGILAIAVFFAARGHGSRVAPNVTGASDAIAATPEAAASGRGNGASSEDARRVSESVRSNVAQAIGLTKVQLQDRAAAEKAESEAPLLEPPGGVVSATPEQQAIIDEIRKKAFETKRNEENHP